MAAPTPKADDIARLKAAQHERRYGKGAAKPTPAAPEKLAIARKSVAKALSTVDNDKREYNRAAQEKWRKANPEIHRERSRASMRKLREKAT